MEGSYTPTTGENQIVLIFHQMKDSTLLMLPHVEPFRCRWNISFGSRLPDIFRQIRRPWIQYIMSDGWHLRTLAHMEPRVYTPIFPDDEVSRFRKSLDELAEAHGYCMDWSIPPDKPINLHALKVLSSVCNDSDTTLCDHLIAGVPTGYHNDIL